MEKHRLGLAAATARTRRHRPARTSSSSFDLNGYPVTLTSAVPNNAMFNISPVLKDPADFHGSRRVHDLVQFEHVFAGLIGHYTDTEGFYDDRDSLPERGVVILADHYPEARKLVGNVDGLAQRLIENGELYDDRGFCKEYLELARAGYGLLREHLPHFIPEFPRTIPISLERAGLVTTRLALGLNQDAAIADEVRVVTKRAHPKDGDEEDLMVSVRWRNLDDIPNLDQADVEVPDFVNPASWASTAAMVLSALARGARPSKIVHRSFMATEQGIPFATRALDGIGIKTLFVTVGTSRNLTPQYYLTDPAVADAGHVLRHFLPSWYDPENGEIHQVNRTGQ